MKARPQRHVADPPKDRPVMVFDGDCNFCRYWISRWREKTEGRIDYEPFQKIAGDYPEIPREAFESAVQFIEPDGSVTSGADAVFRALGYAGKSRMARMAWRVPGFGYFAERVYRFIARHRTAFSLVTRVLWGGSRGKPRYLFARWLFL